MKIAVTGGRDHWPTGEQHAAFLRLWEELGGEILCHGDCPTGVDAYYDAWGRTWARISPRPISTHPFPADWRPDGVTTDYSAGPRRNREMMRYADVLVAFPGTKGTRNCIKAARTEHKWVYIWEAEFLAFLPSEIRLPPPTFGVDPQR